MRSPDAKVALRFGGGGQRIGKFTSHRQDVAAEIERGSTIARERERLGPTIEQHDTQFRLEALHEP